MEISTPVDQVNLLGATQYAAPEYFLGESGSTRSDLFSLGVIAYQMLSGKLPYGAGVPRSRTRAAQRKLAYRSLAAEDREIPAWVDEAIRKAVHPDPNARYAELSEFVFDLRHPNQALLGRAGRSLIERNPLMFWKLLSLLLLVAVIALGSQLAAR